MAIVTIIIVLVFAWVSALAHLLNVQTSCSISVGCLCFVSGLITLSNPSCNINFAAMARIKQLLIYLCVT